MPIGEKYTLKVKNYNSRLQKFAVYQTLPDLIGPSVNPLSLAWMVGAAAPGNNAQSSTSVFGWTVFYGASLGYLQDLDDQKYFMNSVHMPVGVTESNNLSVSYLGEYPHGAPSFEGPPTNGEKGLVFVQSDGNIPTALRQERGRTRLQVGLSMDNKAAVVADLLPNLTYQFTPKPKYYIISGDFREGQVIDQAIMSGAFEVDYRGGTTSVTLIFDEENQFRYEGK